MYRTKGAIFNIIRIVLKFYLIIFDKLLNKFFNNFFMLNRVHKHKIFFSCFVTNYLNLF